MYQELKKTEKNTICNTKSKYNIRDSHPECRTLQSCPSVRIQKKDNNANKITSRETIKTNNIIQCLNPGDATVAEQNARDTTDIFSHPDTGDFINMMTMIGVPIGDASEIWQLLLLGLQDQDFYNNAARINIGPGGIINSNEEIRQSNELFIRVAQMVRPYLNVGDLVGLWSGGFDLSGYAARIGCTTLEESPFGFILDSLYLTNSWGRLGPLWNIISREFVDVAITQGAEFHVFLRVYDLNSVLIRQEVNQIRRLGFADKIFWHPIVSIGADYLELTNNYELSENHQPCNEAECLLRLLTYHAQINPLGRENRTMADSITNQYGLTEDEAMEHILMLSEYYPNMQ